VYATLGLVSQNAALPVVCSAVQSRGRTSADHARTTPVSPGLRPVL
jgi:hypothetical protein